ncbi:MAG: hypothetical protein U0640_12990 [Phycisphaerales bacterium]
MAFVPAPGEQFTIRRKVLKLFGAAFHIYDANNNVVGYCKQKAFKLKEDIRIFTDESMSTELIRIAARSIIDFGATYDIINPDGSVAGSMRRKGMASTFIRDEWLLFDAKGQQVGTVTEDGSFMAFLRRYVEYVNLFSPQSFTLKRTNGTVAANFRQHFNLFVYRLGVKMSDDFDPNEPLDEMVVLAAACVLAAVEGRQG